MQIDDDVLEAAKSIARAQDRTVGEIVSELARQGLTPRVSRAKRNGFPVFEVPSETAPITMEMVKQASEDD